MINSAHVSSFFSTIPVNIASDQSVKNPHLNIHEGLRHRLIIRLLVNGESCFFEDGLELADGSEALALLRISLLSTSEDIVEEEDEGRRLPFSSRFNNWSDELSLCSSKKSGERLIIQIAGAPDHEDAAVLEQPLEGLH